MSGDSVSDFVTTSHSMDQDHPQLKEDSKNGHLEDQSDLNICENELDFGLVNSNNCIQDNIKECMDDKGDDLLKSPKKDVLSYVEDNDKNNLDIYLEDDSNDCVHHETEACLCLENVKNSLQERSKTSVHSSAEGKDFDFEEIIDDCSDVPSKFSIQDRPEKEEKINLPNDNNNKDDAQEDIEEMSSEHCIEGNKNIVDENAIPSFSFEDERNLSTTQESLNSSNTETNENEAYDTNDQPMKDARKDSNSNASEKTKSKKCLDLVVRAAASSTNYTEKLSKVKKGVKPPKLRDVSAPKRPQSAFLLFCQRERSNVSVTGSEQGFVIKELGRRWHGLSKEERETYRHQAAANYTQYKKVMSKSPRQRSQQRLFSVFVFFFTFSLPLSLLFPQWSQQQKNGLCPR